MRKERGICALHWEEKLKYLLTACLSLQHQTICFIRFIFCFSNRRPHAALMMKRRGHLYNGSMCTCMCACLIGDVRVCRCNKKVHNVGQMLASSPRQHLCFREMERDRERGGHDRFFVLFPLQHILQYKSKRKKCNKNET